MPVVSSFLGILIYMYKEQSKPHNMPHVHAFYKNKKVSIAANGKILSGSFPRKQQKALEAWVALREDEIVASWKAMNKDKSEVIKIRGLEV